MIAWPPGASHLYLSAQQVSRKRFQPVDFFLPPPPAIPALRELTYLRGRGEKSKSPGSLRAFVFLKDLFQRLSSRRELSQVNVEADVGVDELSSASSEPGRVYSTGGEKLKAPVSLRGFSRQTQERQPLDGRASLEFFFSLVDQGVTDCAAFQRVLQLPKRAH
jgi:hypothetical protein